MKRLVLVSVLGLLFLVALASGQVMGDKRVVEDASYLRYEGTLTDPSGNPVSGVHEMTFRIYDSPSSLMPVWEEVQQVAVDGGVFEAILGKRSSLPRIDGSDYYIAVVVDGEELLPRHRITGTVISGEDASFGVAGPVATPYFPVDQMDERYVNVEGDSMSGNLAVSGNGVDITLESTGDSNSQIILKNDLGNSATFGVFRSGSINAGKLKIDNAGREIIFPTGNIGMGTTDPDALLQVEGNTGDLLLNATGTGNSAKVRLSDSDSGEEWQIRGSSDGTLRINEQGPGTRLTIQNDTGNVGIGTTSPEAILQVEGNTGDVLVKATGTGNSAKVRLSDSDSGEEWQIRGSSDGAFKINEQGAGARLTIQKDTGNVGIGTTSPESRLHVSGDGADIILESSGDNNSQLILKNDLGNSATIGVMRSGSIDSGELRIGNDGRNIQFPTGNVGIGTTDPAAKLHTYVDESDTYVGYFINDQNTQGHGLLIETDGSDATTNALYVRTDVDGGAGGPNDAMLVTGEGNVGIGTTSPNKRLEILGGADSDLRMTNSTAGSYWELNTRDGGDLDIVSEGYGGVLMTFEPSGKVGIGTTSPWAKLDLRSVDSELIYAIADSLEHDAVITAQSNSKVGDVSAIKATVNAPGGDGSAIGVYGVSACSTDYGGGNFGVFGRSLITDPNASGGSAGVFGWADGEGGGHSVHSGFSHGVWGQTESDRDGTTGVVGIAHLATKGRTRGVYGATYSGGSGAAGVAGYADQGQAKGVWGSSMSPDGIPVYAQTAFGNSSYIGVYSEGVVVASNYYYHVKTSRGDALLYSQASPESWSEDFGESQLKNGNAHIDLDSHYLETVTINDENPMKVFIQLNDDCNGVYVKRGRTGFDVFELQRGQSNASFTYRVIAKQKGDETKRMESIEVPDEDLMTLSRIPKPPMEGETK